MTTPAAGLRTDTHVDVACQDCAWRLAEGDPAETVTRPHTGPTVSHAAARMAGRRHHEKTGHRVEARFSHLIVWG